MSDRPTKRTFKPNHRERSHLFADDSDSDESNHKDTPDPNEKVCSTDMASIAKSIRECCIDYSNDAIINSLRYAVTDETKRISNEEWGENTIEDGNANETTCYELGGVGRASNQCNSRGTRGAMRGVGIRSAYMGRNFRDPNSVTFGNKSEKENQGKDFNECGSESNGNIGKVCVENSVTSVETSRPPPLSEILKCCRRHVPVKPDLACGKKHEN